MVHNYTTGGKKQELIVNMNKDSKMKDMENNILNIINSLEDEIVNLREIVIKNLQNENEKLLQKCERHERHCKV